jgi:hypothetical protein
MSNGRLPNSLSSEAAVDQPARLKVWLPRFAVSALATMLVAGAGAAHAAGLAFSDDFESGTVSKWQPDGTRSMCTVVQRAVDGGTPHGGKDMLECNWNGIVAWNAPDAFSTVNLPQSAWKYTSEFFIRLWLRYDNDVAHTTGGKVLRLFPDDRVAGSSNPRDDFFIIVQMNVPGGPMLTGWVLNGKQGPTFWGQGAPLGDHNWHKIEIYIKASPNTDGIARIWTDGVLRQELTNIATISAGQTWGPLYLMSNWSNNPGWEHGANNHVYWDDVEIYTDASSGASGQMSNASISAGPTPTPPSAVVVH